MVSFRITVAVAFVRAAPTVEDPRVGLYECGEVQAVVVFRSTPPAGAVRRPEEFAHLYRSERGTCA